jgi:multidrug transporter EmrE-like cation transporter
MPGLFYLAIAIVGEVIATSFLRASAGFSQLVPTVVVVVGYGFTFYFFSLALQTIPVGIGYAIWSGAGIVLISIIAYFVYGQSLDLPALIGIGLILAGVLVINLFSQSSAH